MKTFASLLLVGTAFVLSSCSSTQRSISNSGQAPDPEPGHWSSGNRASVNDSFLYRGELSEFDLLGIDRDQFVTDAEIVNTLGGAGDVHIKEGEKILLIQSGAVFPDGDMVKELETHFRVVPFSGVPTGRMRDVANEVDQPAYARTFRLAAARAGAEHIVCYWGALESVRTDMNTKTISWIPFAGWVVPDENQAMRIRLKLAVIDVKTGNWTTIASRSIADRNSRSNRFNRDRADQKQVQELKELAYADGVTQLIEQALEASL